MIQARLPDGTIAQFPDDTPDSVIDFTMKREAMRQGGQTPMSGEHFDSFFKTNPVGRVLDAFGQGASQNWGTTGINPEVEDLMKKGGIFNDYENGKTSAVKSFNEALIRPAAVALQTLFQGLPAAVGGATAATKQLGKEVGLPGVGEAVAAIPEVLPGFIGAPIETLPPLIRQGLGNRVIGPEAQALPAQEFRPSPPSAGTGQRTLAAQPVLKPPVVEQLELPFGQQAPVSAVQGDLLAQQPDITLPEVTISSRTGEVTPHPGGGFDIDVQGTILYAATREEAARIAANPPLTGNYIYPRGYRGESDVTVPERPPAETASPERPTDPLPPQTNHLDAKGNVKLDTLNTVEDVNRAIQQSSKPPSGTEAAPSQIEDLADAVGVQPRLLEGLDHGPPEEIEAKIKILTDSAAAIHDAAARVEMDKADIPALMEFTEAMDRHWMIQDAVLKEPQAPKVAEEMQTFVQGETTAEGAPKPTVEQEQRISQLEQQQLARAAAVQTYTNPKQVSNFSQSVKSFGARANDMLLELWINGLLSGLATHTTYALGNLSLLLLHGPESLVAAALGKLHGGEKVSLGEAPAGLFGLFKGIPEGLIASWEAAKSGLTVRLPGEKAASFAFSTTKAIPGVAGEVIRLPTRGVAGIHSFNRMIGYRQGIAELAARNAGGDLAEMKRLMDNPTLAMMEAARGQTTDIALMGRGGPWVQEFGDFVNRHPAFKWVAPFVRMSGNAVRQGLLERTPLGALLSSDIRANLAGRNGAIARDTQYARIAVGSAIGAAVIGYAMQGKITGGGPLDSREAALKRMSGWQPYSVQFGDTYYNYGRLGPLALLLGSFADMQEIGHQLSAGDNDKAAALLMTSISHSLVDETWIRTPAALVQALEDKSGVKWERFINDQLSSFLPFSVAMGQTARAVDPYSREARTIIDAFKAKIPFESETLLPRRDIFGEPIPNRSALGAAGVTAIYETQANKDPVIQAMQRVHIFPAPVLRTLDMGGVPVQLTDEQHDNYARIAGRMAKMQLNNIVNSPGFNQWPTYVQREVLTKTISASRQAAGVLIKMQYPSIISDAIAAKQAEMGGAQPVHPVKQ